MKRSIGHAIALASAALVTAVVAAPAQDFSGRDKLPGQSSEVTFTVKPDTGVGPSGPATLPVQQG